MKDELIDRARWWRERKEMYATMPLARGFDERDRAMGLERIDARLGELRWFYRRFVQPRGRLPKVLW